MKNIKCNLLVFFVVRRQSGNFFTLLKFYLQKRKKSYIIKKINVGMAQLVERLVRIIRKYKKNIVWEYINGI